MAIPLARRTRRSLSTALILVLVAVPLLSLDAPPAAAAGTLTVSGPITVNTTWTNGTTVVLTGNVTVAAGVTLTIEPDVVVKAYPSVHLYVAGRLLANGTAGARILLWNYTAGAMWGGVQFNSTGTGFLSWASIQLADRGVSAVLSSPSLSNLTVSRANAGFDFRGSTSVSLVDSSVNLAGWGVHLYGSSGSLLRNRINGTSFGVYAEFLGSLALTRNVITNTTAAATPGGSAFGVLVNGLTSADLEGNVVRGVISGYGPTGTAGGLAAGIAVNGTGLVTLYNNVVNGVQAGRGGNGAGSLVGVGGTGGEGGPAVGILTAIAPTLSVQANKVTNITGGRAGDGGSSATAGGGAGGLGGTSVGMEAYLSSVGANVSGNLVDGVSGGFGGNGGLSTGSTTGAGGRGGDGFGLFVSKATNAASDFNTVLNIAGGAAGNSTPLSAAGTVGGAGGQALGISVYGVDGSASLDANSVSFLAGGSGGSGHTGGGVGGNATALAGLGDGLAFNATTVGQNYLSSIVGGTGGAGYNVGGAGGPSTGIAFFHVALTAARNTVDTVVGGTGGDALSAPNPAGIGGSAIGFAAVLVPSGASSEDAIISVSNGTPGIGGPSPGAVYGFGFYFLGDSTVTTTVALDNTTVSGTSGYDLYVDNYTTATTINASFAATKVAVMAAANLTVRNFLAVRVLWPNGATFLSGATVAVRDNDRSAYNRTSATGQADWILVTNRAYVQSDMPTYNKTTVLVYKSGFSFVNDPRVVNMTASQTQTFTMIDQAAPVSAVSPLPTYETSKAFAVDYTASDGNGTGLATITLWYTLNGSVWAPFLTQAASTSGSFGFVAPSDGVYRFATTATDNAGNSQVLSNATSVGTTVDTLPPSSRVIPLPRYETSRTFAVAWGPAPGTTDIATYTILVNDGSGWAVWIANTTATSGTFTAPADGPVAFLSLSFDLAGNAETKSANDTWTVVDTVAPTVLSTAPTGSAVSSSASIVIVFSEAMNESSVEASLSVSPTVNGTFRWTNGSTVLTFTPSQPLQAGASYSVTIGTGARDLAGNALASPATFSFGTAPSPPSELALFGSWPFWLVVVIVAAALAALLLLRRRSRAEAASEERAAGPAAPAPAKEPSAIDDVFLLYGRDGLLIKHETRRLRPDIDTDILSGMLTAVQQFVKDSFRGEEGEELNEMTVGQMHILIGRGKWLILAAMITGGDVDAMNEQMKRAIADMEDHHWDQLEDWDGDMALAKTLSPYLRKLIRGDYVPGAAPPRGAK